jgi:hypothetical protein
VDNEIRKIAWPILLNIQDPVTVKDISKTDNTSTPKMIVFDKDQKWTKDSKLSDRKMADQIDKDVNRSLNHFNLSFGLKMYRNKLSEMMQALFETNQAWSYYQGYNDVCSVSLVAMNQNMGYHVAQSLSHYYFKDFLKSSFDKGVIPALNLMMKIIQATNPDIHDKISFIQMPTFAVSWIITWFAHDLDDINDTYRIFDF